MQASNTCNTVPRLAALQCVQQGGATRMRAPGQIWTEVGAVNLKSFALHAGGLGWLTGLNGAKLRAMRALAVSGDQCKRTEGRTGNASAGSDLDTCELYQCAIVCPTRWWPCLAHCTECKRVEA